MENIRTNARYIYRFAIFLLFLIIPVSIMYLWNSSYSLDAPIDNGKFGTFGDFIGGVLGSIWSLCGVLLFYSALREQRADFANNKTALTKQATALNTQIEEFRLQREEFVLQREELSQTRTVFVEQSKTLRLQRLDSTYFSLLALYNKVISDLDSHDPDRNFFKSLKFKLFESKTDVVDPKENHLIAQSNYLYLFYENKEELTHYFRLVYRIIKIIEDSDIKDTEKFRYVKILRSQLSENEMVAIYYNSHSSFAGESYKLILKYNLLKHLPSISKVEFKRYLPALPQSHKILGSDSVKQSNRTSSTLLKFNFEMHKLLRQYLEVLEQKIIEDDFNGFKVSYPLSEYLIISLDSCEHNELNIEISSIDDHIIESIAELALQNFINYFKAVLYDAFIFSRYIDVDEEKSLIKDTFENNILRFEIRSKRKLTISSDIE